MTTVRIPSRTNPLAPISRKNTSFDQELSHPEEIPHQELKGPEKLIGVSIPKASGKVASRIASQPIKNEIFQKPKEMLTTTNENSVHLTKADTTAGSKNKLPCNDHNKQEQPAEKEICRDAKILDRLDLSAISVKEDASVNYDFASFREEFPEWEYSSKKKTRSLEEKRVSSTSNNASSQFVNFPSFWAYAKGLNLSKEKELTLKQKLGFFEKLSLGCQSFRLSPSLMSEKEQIIAFSAVPYNPNDTLHFNVLRTISVKLTGNYNCPHRGAHWELIGFSTDPAKDLRSVGMLGLLQILAFLNMYEPLLKEAFDFSMNSESNPPLCSSLLGTTLITLELAKTSKLHPMILNQRSAINATNNMYFAIFHSIYRKYKANPSLTMKNYASVYQEVRKAALKDPQMMLESFAKDMQDFQAMPCLYH